jgi:hypothetical protein
MKEKRKKYEYQPAGTMHTSTGTRYIMGYLGVTLFPSSACTVGRVSTRYLVLVAS